MKGHQLPLQAQLFHTGFNLEARVRANHPQRAVALRIDFDFAYQAVADTYGDNGNVSVAPPVIITGGQGTEQARLRVTERQHAEVLGARFARTPGAGQVLNRDVVKYEAGAEYRSREVECGYVLPEIGQQQTATAEDGAKQHRRLYV